MRLGTFVALVLTTCTPRATITSEDAAAQTSSPLTPPAASGDAGTFTSEAEAIALVAKLPELAELTKQDWTPAHPDGLGRKVKPIVESRGPVDRACSDDSCHYTIDVVDESEAGTATPALRFYVHAKTRAISIEVDLPYPKGKMDYTAFNRLETEQHLIGKRVFALPEVAALKKRIDATPASPPCAKPYVGLMPTGAPVGNCRRGPGCTWTYEVRTPNGCVSSLWATFEIDSPTGDVRVFDLKSAQMIPYASWRVKKSRRF